MELYVSNNPILKYKENYISSDEFILKITGDEGLDWEEGNKIWIDVNDFDEDYFDAFKENFGSDMILIKTKDEIPEHIIGLEVIDIRNHVEIENNEFSDKFIEDNKNNIEEYKYDNNYQEEKLNENINTNIENLFINVQTQIESYDENIDNKEAEVYVFGSAKGGSGKTFTCVLSAYHYAKQNPHKKVALADFDILDGQIGITIHKIGPTMFDFYKSWESNEKDYSMMSNYKVKSEHFPSNLDFYLAPKDFIIKNENFWNDVFINLIKNYDRVYFDTGISYMEYHPIYTLYKIADKIILTSSTSIKSVSSVIKQISKLKGINENPIFTKEDNLDKTLNLVITQAVIGSDMNKTVIETFKKNINILGIFGYMTELIEKAEYYSQWNIFDNKPEVLKIINNIND